MMQRFLDAFKDNGLVFRKKYSVKNMTN